MKHEYRHRYIVTVLPSFQAKCRCWWKTLLENEKLTRKTNFLFPLYTFDFAMGLEWKEKKETGFTRICTRSRPYQGLNLFESSFTLSRDKRNTKYFYRPDLLSITKKIYATKNRLMNLIPCYFHFLPQCKLKIFHLILFSILVLFMIRIEDLNLLFRFMQ